VAIFDFDLLHLALTPELNLMAQQKLQRKDFQIAVKTGAALFDELKFAKEATKGELFYNLSDKKLYIATSSAGASDAILYNTDAFNITPAAFANTLSLSLDGVDDYATLTTPYSAITGNKSITGWFYFDSVSTQSIFAPVGANSFNSYGWFVTNATLVKFKTGTAIQSFTVPTLSTGTWYHMAVTGDGTNLKLYINGTQAGSTMTDGDWSIGEFFKTHTAYKFNGYVDEIGLWTGTTLSSADITAITGPAFAAGSKAVDLSTYTGLTHWWRFGDAGDTSLISSDQIGSNDLALHNGPTYNSAVP
jgi:hypothetical protein